MCKMIKDVMRKAYTINVNKTFIEALDIMTKEQTNSILVLDDDGKLVGMINTGMLIRAIVPDYLEDDIVAAHFANQDIFREDIKKAKDLEISNFMLKNPQKVKENSNLMEVSIMALSSKQFRVPVVDGNDRPVGLITRTELRRVFADVLGIGDL
ncbi:CBS domain-containing protein [Candidatus Parcubacteria bacterium]|nr:CBS domain-containing protein [Candidatus Parcubacteria bacterium]